MSHQPEAETLQQTHLSSTCRNILQGLPVAPGIRPRLSTEQGTGLWRSPLLSPGGFERVLFWVGWGWGWGTVVPPFLGVAFPFLLGLWWERLVSGRPLSAQREHEEWV